MELVPGLGSDDLTAGSPQVVLVPVRVPPETEDLCKIMKEELKKYVVKKENRD